MAENIAVVGAGLAGCEAAWSLANMGFHVALHEMKPRLYSPAHHYPGFAELVCSNSLKASRLESAAGLLKAEMKLLGSLLVPCAEKTSIPAGGALAVDRERFSDLVTEAIRAHPNIRIVEGEVVKIPAAPAVVATGPLTSDSLAEHIREMCGSEYLSFFDAAAPIVTLESIDRDKVFFAARYGRGNDDYINCPMSKDEYERFHAALVSAETAPLHDFEQDLQRVYEGCMPVETMAKRGADTLRYGPMRPVGLRDPRTGHRPWAVLQLRRENADGTSYNLVGFQTNLKFQEQKRVFSMIPGLEHAEFIRYGVMHRNTFLDSPRLLDATFALRSNPMICFGGQITGVEGYMESAASGLLAARALGCRLLGKEPLHLPRETMLGALSAYVSDPSIANFQPMGANMGILPPLGQHIKEKQKRYLALAERAVESLKQALAGTDSVKHGQ